MQQVLIVIHLIIVLALVGVVLLQRSEGGGLGMGGGGGGGGVGGFMTGRGQANALTRATAILAALFFLTSITLSILATTNRAPSTIFNAPVAQPGSAPAGGAPAAPGQGGAGGVLDQLRQIQPAPSQAPVPAPGPQAPTSQ